MGLLVFETKKEENRNFPLIYNIIPFKYRYNQALQTKE